VRPIQKQVLTISTPRDKAFTDGYSKTSARQSLVLDLC